MTQAIELEEQQFADEELERELSFLFEKTLSLEQELENLLS